MHYALSVVANEGQRQLPFYVQRVFNPNGDIVRSFSPRTERRILSRETADTLCTILLHGPASKAYIKGYNVAGKTGTTQKIINHKYSHNRHISSFSGFFPHRTRDVHISLTVDSPQFKGTAYGAQVAAPIFKKMAETIVQYLGLPPEPQLI
jgi:cell division protein FtsI/penicillin-binding protein 2